MTQISAGKLGAPALDYSHHQGQTIVLLARSAFAAAPFREMQRLAETVARRPGVARAIYAFSEQGPPALRDVLLDLGRQGVPEVVVLPLILPVEPGFRTWLVKALSRWGDDSSGTIPQVRIGGDMAGVYALEAVIDEMVTAAAPLPAFRLKPSEGSIVPAQVCRVLVCHGGACSQAGASSLWVRLRNEQQRLHLRTMGRGTMTAKSTCLGPCGLAPVMQVWPEGTVYGGVDEAALDRIIAEDLIGGCPVDDFAYAADGHKQRLRSHLASSPALSIPGDAS